MIPEWWHWTVFGIALIVAELVIPAMVLIWFGLGALLVGAIVAVIPAAGLTAQLAIWGLASVGMVAAWFKVFKPNLHKTRVGMSDAAVIGEVGLLVKDVEPFRKGAVRFQKPLLGAESWECIADEKIRSGERVRVVAIEGSFLKVGKV
jgi:hypothetical protein